MPNHTKKSICLFAHYSKLPSFSIYITLFVNELSNHFDEVIVAANQRNMNNENDGFNENVSVKFFENEGYDLGLFYKILKETDLKRFHQIAFVNDSNVLFNKLTNVFQWGKNIDTDFWGLIDSWENPWFSSHQESYHIQSHFLVLNEKSIHHLPYYFEKIDIKSIFREKDPKKLRRLVIDQWEIGLSRFLISKNLTYKSYINCIFESEKYFKKGINVSHAYYNELILEGYPLIKKRIIVKKGWRSYLRKPEEWEKLVLEHGNNHWNMPHLIQNLKTEFVKPPMKILKWRKTNR